MRRPRSAAPALLVAASLLWGGVARAHAQARLTGTVDAGAASVQYDEYLRTQAVTVSPAGRLDLPRGSVVARGAWSRYESGNSSFQGLLAGNLLVPVGARLQAELGALGSSTYYGAAADYYADGGERAGSLLGELRLHLSGDARGAWAGLTGGAVTDGFDRRTYWQGELAAWRRVRSVTVSAQARPTWASGQRFTDAEVTARWWIRDVELSGNAGTRAGDVAMGARSWLELGAVAWMLPRLAIVAAGGRYPADVAQGVPGARYATLALRIATHPPPRIEATARPTTTRAPSLALLRLLPPAGAFTSRLLADGRVLLRVRAPEAAQVELMGDFTNWEPVALARAEDGAWERAFALAPGTYRFNVRRDGGAWEVPPGVSALDDDFGGRVGLFIVA